MPRLVELYEEHESLRDQFEILAFHDATVSSFEELDEKMAHVVENRWGGKPLPFPILLDASGETIKTFGIRSYPTNVLIDPQGRLVKGDAEENLKRVLEELAAGTEDAPERRSLPADLPERR